MMQRFFSEHSVKKREIHSQNKEKRKQESVKPIIQYLFYINNVREFFANKMLK